MIGRTDSEETIQRRLLEARAEMETGPGAYDYVIVNDELEAAYAELQLIVRGRERCRNGRPLEIAHSRSLTLSEESDRRGVDTGTEIP